jgi:hypothetical protein
MIAIFEKLYIHCCVAPALESTSAIFEGKNKRVEKNEQDSTVHDKYAGRQQYQPFK